MSELARVELLEQKKKKKNEQINAGVAREFNPRARDTSVRKKTGHASFISIKFRVSL